MTQFKAVVAAAARRLGVDLVRFGGVRHAVGRRARLLAALGIDLVIDVGANQGQFAFEIRGSGYAGQIISVEPLTAPFRRLSAFASRDGNWTVIQSAVGALPGSGYMHVAANRGASSSFLPMLELHARVAPQARIVTDEEVRIATIDALVRPYLTDRSAIFTKIDVQGYELEVLAGGSDILSQSPLVQLEMSLIPLYEGGCTYPDVLKFMGEQGFSLIGIEPGLSSATGVLLQADGIFAAGPSLQRLLAAWQ